MKHSLAYKFSFTTILLLILAYRLYILFTYGAHRIDEDQALMWYGTASFLSGGIDEPHFLGQKYGSMLESIVAVPFYCIGIPLNYAVPLGTIILWMAPFVTCAYYAGKRNELMGCFILILSLCFNYNYDVITNIPRSFLSGFALSIIGVILLNEDYLGLEKKMLVCPIVFSIAFVMTDSTLATTCMGIAYFLTFKEHYSHIRKFLIGLEIGFLIILFCNKLYYILNEGFIIHVATPFFKPSIEVLTKNIENINALMCSFSVMSFDGYPLSLLFIIIVIAWFCFKSNSEKMYLLLFAILVGTIFVLSLTKSLDFNDSISYSQTRIFLFFPYSLALLMYFISVENKILTYVKTSIAILLCVTSFCVVVYKSYIFNNALEEDRNLYRMYIRNERTDILLKTASDIKNLAAINGCNIVVTLGMNLVVGYTSAALNYSEYELYNAWFERRNSVYHKFKKNDICDNVMFVYLRNHQIEKVDVAHVSGNLIDYIYETYNTKRDCVYEDSPGVY